MKIVFLRIYSFFFYIVFLGFFALIFPLHFILLQFNTRWTHNASHWLNGLWGWVVLYPFGIWIKKEGKHHLKKGQVYIIAPNHSSYLDIPICNVSIPITFRFLGKAELNSLPVFGYMFKRLHIAVNRENRKDAYGSYVKAREKLEDGTSVLVYPEGTIPDKTKVTLLRFKDGAFRMAIANKVPLVPVTIVGANRALADDGKLLIRPTRIKVIFHEPIDTAGMTLDDIPAFRQQVYDLIYTTLEQHGAAVGAPQKVETIS